MKKIKTDKGENIRSKKVKSDYTDLPVDYISGQPRLEIIGNSCLVDGLEKILEYTPEKIRLKIGKKEITFNGDSLFINSFSHTGAIVEGIIMTMEFSS